MLLRRISQESILAGLILLLGSSLSAQSLDLPAREPLAPRGTAFALSIAALPLEEREEKILADPLLAPLLSNEGVMLQTRYRRTD